MLRFLLEWTYLISTPSAQKPWYSLLGFYQVLTFGCKYGKPLAPPNFLASSIGGVLGAVGAVMALSACAQAGKGPTVDANVVEGAAHYFHARRMWAVSMKQREKIYLTVVSRHETCQMSKGKFMAMGALETPLDEKLLKVFVSILQSFSGSWVHRTGWGRRHSLRKYSIEED